MRDQSGSYESYIEEAASYSQISPEREVELSSTIRESNNQGATEDAVTELVQANLRLVIHCACEFSSFVDSPGCPLTRTDLIGEGNIGLIKAARTYNAHHESCKPDDQDKGSVRFSTYAYACIRSHMLRALKRARLVHIPDQHFVHWKKMRQLKLEHGDALTDEMLLKELGVSPSGLERLKTSLRSGTVRFEDMCSDDDGRDWGDILPDEKIPGPEDEADRRDLRRFLIKEMRQLPPRTRKVLTAMFLKKDTKTLSDLARKFGFSRERARQICCRGLSILRRHFDSVLSPEDRMALLTSDSH